MRAQAPCLSQVTNFAERKEKEREKKIKFLEIFAQGEISSDNFDNHFLSTNSRFRSFSRKPRGVFQQTIHQFIFLYSKAFWLYNISSHNFCKRVDDFFFSQKSQLNSIIFEWIGSIVDALCSFLPTIRERKSLTRIRLLRVDWLISQLKDTSQRCIPVRKGLSFNYTQVVFNLIISVIEFWPG